MLHPPKPAHKPLPVIEATFARIMSHFGHRLPEEDVPHRRRGRACDDPEEYARRKAEDQAEVTRIHAMLKAKGFPSSY